MRQSFEDLGPGDDDVRPGLSMAVSIAAIGHHGQVDKDGKAYILHPLRVMLAMPDRLGRIVAVLHDLAEDTKITLLDLKGMGFEDEVLEAVDALTRRQGESYRDYVKRAGANPLARRVKLADLRDNLNPVRLSAVRLTGLVERYRDALRYLEGLEDKKES